VYTETGKWDTQGEHVDIEQRAIDMYLEEWPDSGGWESLNANSRNAWRTAAAAESEGESPVTSSAPDERRDSAVTAPAEQPGNCPVCGSASPLGGPLRSKLPGLRRSRADGSLP